MEFAMVAEVEPGMVMVVERFRNGIELHYIMVEGGSPRQVRDVNSGMVKMGVGLRLSGQGKANHQ
jgi:hypothetical protein